MKRASAQSPRTRSLHSRRRKPILVRPERATRLRFRTQESLEEIHYIVHAPPAYHYSLDGFADDNVEENWEAEELTVPELRAALAKRRLSTQGRKMDLVERLTAVLQQERAERRHGVAENAVKRRKLDAILSAQQEEMEDRLEASQLEPLATKHHHDDDCDTTASSSTTSSTNFSFFFNSLETDSSSLNSAPSLASTSSTSSSTASSVSSGETDHRSTNGDGSAGSEDGNGTAPTQPSGRRRTRRGSGDIGGGEEGETEKDEDGMGRAELDGKDGHHSPGWGEADTGGDGLVDKLTRFLEQIPSSPSRGAFVADSRNRKRDLLPADLFPAATVSSSTAAPSSPSFLTTPPASPARRPLKGVLKKREVKAPEEMTANELKEHLIAYGVAGAALKQKKAALVALLNKTIVQHSNGGSKKPA